MLKENIKLLPFQEEGVEFMTRRQGNMILGDEQGCGKTIQAIAYTAKHNLRTLVICPAYLKFNWMDEIEKFTYKSCAILNSKDDDITSAYFADYVIVNYEVVHQLENIIEQLGFDIVVCDESQYIMNPNSRRTKATIKVIKKISKRILMSGTPIKNKVMEFYDQLSLVEPTYCTKSEYSSLYNHCEINMNKHEVIPEVLKVLNANIKDIFLRRTKDQVLTDLPPKAFQVLRQDVKVKLNKDLKGLQFITHAKKTLSTAKLKDLYKLIDDHMENNQKVIVFSQYVDNIKAVLNKYDSSVAHYGEVSIEDRAKNVKKFQEDPSVNILVGNISTAVGYTATSASVVIFLDLPWTIADLKQAEDRAHRISQEKHVTIQYIIAKDSIEEKILKLLQSKEKLMKAVLDGKITEESLDIKNELLQLL